MEWINNNTGILILTGIFIPIGIFLLLRWQANEQGKDSRRLAIQRDRYNQWIEIWERAHLSGHLTKEKFLEALRTEDELMEIFIKGSKHQWFKDLCIQVRRKFRKTDSVNFPL